MNVHDYLVVTLAITTTHHILSQANNLGLIGGYATLAMLEQQCHQAHLLQSCIIVLIISPHAMPALMCGLATWLHNLPQLHVDTNRESLGHNVVTNDT